MFCKNPLLQPRAGLQSEVNFSRTSKRLTIQATALLTRFEVRCNLGELNTENSHLKSARSISHGVYRLLMSVLM